MFHLTKPFGPTMVEALTMPGTSAIPAGSTTAADKSSPSKWDSDPTTQVFTGPYMIKSYSPGRSITLVRNPNWNRKLDGVRPAYSDQIVWNAGADPTVAARPDARLERPADGRHPALLGAQDAHMRARRRSSRSLRWEATTRR